MYGKLNDTAAQQVVLINHFLRYSKYAKTKCGTKFLTIVELWIYKLPSIVNRGYQRNDFTWKSWACDLAQ